MFMLSLLHRGPADEVVLGRPGSWVFLLPWLRLCLPLQSWARAIPDAASQPLVLPSKEPPFFGWYPPNPPQITDGSKFKAEIIVEQLVMLALALGSIYLIFP